MAADKQDKVLNFSSEREQSGACSSSAEREKNQGKNFLNVPTLRFPEFSGEWKKERLKDKCSFFSGGTPSSTNKTYYDGDIPFIRSGEIASDSTELFLSESGLNNSSAKIVEKGDLLLALYGATSGQIAISQIKGAINQAILCIRSPYDKVFLKSAWEKRVEKILQAYLQGGQGNLSAEIVKNLSFYFPSLQEQSKIGQLILLIDERVSTQIRIIEDLKQLRSAIRNRIFKKIQQEPEQIVQIKEILTYEQPTKYLVSNTEYVDDSSLIPVLTANKAFILGYTLEKQGVYDKGDCIILDDFTLDCKIVDFPFKVKSSAIKILRAKNRNMLRYAFEYLKYLDLETSEHKRHYITEIEPIEISLPSQEEIENILHLFELLDMRIVNAEKTWSSYLSQKQFLLQTLFI